MSNIQINAQYIKDLSFEIPKSPEIFLEPIAKPDIALSIDIDAKKIADHAFEVILKITAKATKGEKVVFISELSYAGIFSLDAKIKDESEIEAVLLIYCPSLLFPFARKIMADCTLDGGFPPLMLEPIDFAGLYHKRKEAKESAA